MNTNNCFDNSIKSTIECWQENWKDTIYLSFNNIFNPLREVCLLSSHMFTETLVTFTIAFGDGLWCIFDFDTNDLLISSDVDNISIAHQLENIYNGVDQAAINQADVFIFNSIQESKIKNIKNDIVKLLSKTEDIKFQHAITDYNEGRYYQAAMILCDIIDSVSIKFNHMQWKKAGGVKRYDDVPLIYENGIQKHFHIDQARSAFSLVLTRELLRYLNIDKDDDEDLGKYKKVLSKIKEFAKQNPHVIRERTADFHTALNIILICRCMDILFGEFQWTNYPNKPQIINRNWLMHGMYDYDDITKIDCVKLMLLLRQIVSLYNSLNIQQDSMLNRCDSQKTW